MKSFVACVFAALSISQPIFAAENIVDTVLGPKTKSYEHLEAFYQDLHRHPELSLKETRTAGKVAEEFRRLGFETIDNIGGGVVGILRNGAGPVTLVRSELDALPVQENSRVKFPSENPGVMHACGHDFHTTALLGTAEVMLHEKDKWKGTLVFVAQPAEELVKGAQAMVDAGLFKKIPHPDQCVALHTKGLDPEGKVGLVGGPALAAVDSLDVIIRGVGTHGAAPHKGIDPIVLASEFVLKLQALRAREIDPIEPAVVTVGSIHGGTKHNIISEEVKLQLSVRTYNENVRAFLLKRIKEIAEGLSKTAGAPAPTVNVVESAPATISDVNLTERFRKDISAVLGESNMYEAARIMGSEDFGIFGNVAKVPSVFIWLGASNGSDVSISNHSPKFAPNFKNILPVAVKAVTAGLMDLHNKR